MLGPDLLLEAIVVLRVATTTWEPESNHKLIQFQIKVGYVRNMYKEFVVWWEKPLVVALKHSEGIKHTVLFQQQKAYKINKNS
jgi:hypothetical protein